MQFDGFCYGISVEFLDGDIMLRGGQEGQLEFIDYWEKYKYHKYSLPPTIRNLHICSIYAIQRIARNMVITVSGDGYIKVIDPICLCYLKFRGREFSLHALAYFY